MNFRHSAVKAGLIPALAAIAVLAAALWQGASVSATSEEAVSSVTLPTVALAQNSSYVSDAYFGVLHVKTGDGTVACASADSKNRLVVTAVGAGSTTVTFWYRSAQDSGWISTSLPVTVTEKASSQASSVQAGGADITFSQSSAVIGAGETITPQGIKLSGFSTEASSLLWMSSSDMVAAVGKTTGRITGVSKGTTTIYAVDPTTKVCGSYTVTVL